jgi:transposase
MYDYQEGFHPVLKKFRWLLRKLQENLTNKQRFRLRDLLRYNLKSVRAYLLKEAFSSMNGIGTSCGPVSSR